MNFTNISNKSILGKILRLPLKFIPQNAKLPILQGKLRGKRWIAGSFNHGCWLGSYEYKKRLLFEKTIIENSVVFDIGAHAGFYTLLSSELVGPKGKVLAFEPVPRNLHYLKEHLRINQCRNVMVIEAAVSDKDDIVHFNEGPNSSMGYISSKGNLKVKSVRLDKLILEGEIPIPNFIKIDVEGAETAVLRGAQSLLANYHPVLFLSIHGEENHRKCCSFLKRLSYDLEPIDGKDIKKSQEILVINYDKNIKISNKNE